MIPLRFTLEDADLAYEAWGANCGPGALAAIMGMTLDEVHPHLRGFDQKHYTNPSMMNEALRTIGHPWKKIGAAWPRYGLVRIQWEGPWTELGVPMRARYRYTHWVGAERGRSSIGIFDINCMRPGELGSGWCSLNDWSTILVPHIVEQYRRATGKWHITHAIEIPEAEVAGGEWVPRKVADR